MGQKTPLLALEKLGNYITGEYRCHFTVLPEECLP